jgi:hypothetical protein
MLVSLFFICIRGNNVINLFNFFVECRGCQSDHRGRASSVKLHFSRNSVSFRFVPSFGIGSSAELGMPRNGYFLLQNN